MNENKKENKLVGLYLFLVVCALVLFLLWVKNLYFGALGGNPFDFSSLEKGESRRSALGALGDYFGGLLNPILAFLSFIALLWTLKINQEELAETRKELARAAQAQEDSKKVMDAQLKTQSLQQFDSLFFALLNQLTSKLAELQTEPYGKALTNFYKFDFVGMGFWELSSLRANILEKTQLSLFFIFLYQILKNIDDKLSLIQLKKDYSNIVRSLIPEHINKMLLVNCAVDEKHEFNKFKELLIKFEFFEHIDIYKEEIYASANLIHASSLYSAQVYGKNLINVQVYQSDLFKEFKKTSNFHKILISILHNTDGFKKVDDNHKDMSFVKEATDVEMPISRFVFYDHNSANDSYGRISVDFHRVNNFRLEASSLYLQCANDTEYELQLKVIEDGCFSIDNIQEIKLIH